MPDPRARLRRLRRRLRRLERREESALRRWIEDTENLLHVSVLLFVPLTIAAVTVLANALPSLSFLLFPPLASGAYTLFADPEGRFASPIRFVAGLTIGAVCGWIALLALGSPGGGSVDPGAAMAAVLLTGIVTWLLDVEEPGSFAVALLLLVQEAPPGVYALSVAAASAIVAGVYVAWHRTIYEHRAEFLYTTTGRDDDVLVPMVEGAEPVARLGARIAGGHEHGRLVLLGILGESAADGESGDAADAPSDVPADGDDSASEQGAPDAKPADSDQPDPDTTFYAEASADGPGETVPVDTFSARATSGEPGEGAEQPDPSADETALIYRLEELAEQLSGETGARSEVLVARGSSPAAVTRESAREAGTDLILAPFTDPAGDGFAASLFASPLDVGVGHIERERWRRILVPIRSAGDLAHRKVDIARRVAGQVGRVTVAHCIDDPSERRRAVAMCSNVVDAYDGRFETHVANVDIDDFIADHASASDLIVLGASTDRSPVSRFLSRPTYERVRDVDTDLLVVHAGRP